MQAGLSLCWSHIPHCWKSHVTAHLCKPIQRHSKCMFWLFINGGAHAKNSADFRVKVVGDKCIPDEKLHDFKMKCQKRVVFLPTYPKPSYNPTHHKSMSSVHNVCPSPSTCSNKQRYRHILKLLYLLSSFNQ